MLKNIIFDMGNVLLVYDPKEMAQKFTRNPKNAETIRKAVFQSPEWAMLDRGTITEDAFIKTICERLPEELQWDAKNVFAHWHECMRDIPGAYEFVAQCRERGMGVYVLSNASLRFDDYAYGHSVFQIMDGVVVSAKVQMVKPTPEIFHYICDKYSLVPEETLFLDDVEANVQGAKNCGINAICFDGDYVALQKHLRDEGVL